MSISYQSILGLSQENIDYLNVAYANIDKLSVSTIQINDYLQPNQAVITDGNKALQSYPYSSTGGGTNNFVSRNLNGDTTLNKLFVSNITGSYANISVINCNNISGSNFNFGGWINVNPTMTTGEINTIIADVNNSYIYFSPGTYTLTSCLVVNRSNV